MLCFFKVSLVSGVPVLTWLRLQIGTNELSKSPCARENVLLFHFVANGLVIRADTEASDEQLDGLRALLGVLGKDVSLVLYILEDLLELPDSLDFCARIHGNHLPRLVGKILSFDSDFGQESIPLLRVESRSCPIFHDESELLLVVETNFHAVDVPHVDLLLDKVHLGAHELDIHFTLVAFHDAQDVLCRGQEFPYLDHVTRSQSRYGFHSLGGAWLG